MRLSAKQDSYLCTLVIEQMFGYNDSIITFSVIKKKKQYFIVI